jgi:DinB family protein
MSRLALIPALLLLTTAAPARAQITEVDRQHLIAHMEMTGGWLLDEVSHLSRAQLDFRRAPGTWSIMEVVEHLVVVGPIYWDDLQKGVHGPPRGGRALSGSDAAILWYGIDRTHRETALTSETPKGELRDLRAGLDAYRKQHARLLEYIKTTKDDLRNRIVERQGCDAYQWALLISTHEQRHILQIREIKADPKFPSK